MLCLCLLFITSRAWALTAGTTYTVEVDAIGSTGSIVDLALSTTTTADSNGKISFSLTDVPTQSSYNFLLVTIKDSNGIAVRRSLCPTAAAGSTTNLGISPMTDEQVSAMLTAMSTASTDDPIMVLFGFIIVRTAGFTSADVTHLANLGRLAIRNGFNVYLEAKIGAAKMSTFRTAIVTGLGTYASNIKESVQATTATDAKNQRAEAASLLSQVLIDAASTADFDVGFINAAMDAAGDQAEDYLSGDGSTMAEATVSAIDSVMSSNYMKLAAERLRKRYTAALTTLSASASQVTRVNTAITTLSAALLAAFQGMEDAFSDEEALGSKASIDAEFTEAQTAMNTAFNQFLANIASTNAEIDQMITDISNGFGIPVATLNLLRGAAATNSQGQAYYNGMFTFRDSSGSGVNNWPITMVVPVSWVSTNYATTFTYARDTLGVPVAMVWLDADDDGDTTDASYQKRHDFDATNSNTVAGDEKGMPAGLAALFGMREDMEIINARKWAGLSAASRDMLQSGYNGLSTADKATPDGQIAAGTLTLIASEDTAAADDATGATLTQAQLSPLNDLKPWTTATEKEGLQDLYFTRVTAVANNIGPATITAAQKKALVDTSTMPDFQ